MELLCFGLWLLLAGEVTVEVCLWGGAISLAMGIFSRNLLGIRYPLSRRHLRLVWQGLRYLISLLGEMLKAGFVVMGHIYTRGETLEPVLVHFHTSLQDDTLRAVLADSITLTAGTITVSEYNGELLVHALDRSLARDLEQSAFQKKLERMEG